MDQSPLHIELRAGGVLILTLDRPGRLNAIDNTLARSLLSALQAAEGNPAVRVVLLRGAGRAFCAGRDVGAPPGEEDLVLVQAIAQALVRLPQPVVAAVQGWAVGAGLEWMLDADLVVAADDARFKLPEASLGVFVTGGLTATLAAAVGLPRARALMLLGEPFTARQAHEWGLVWQLAPAAQLDAQALEVAGRLAALEPGVAEHFKRVLNQVGLGAFESAVALESQAQRQLMGGAATRPQV